MSTVHWIGKADAVAQQADLDRGLDGPRQLSLDSEGDGVVHRLGQRPPPRHDSLVVDASSLGRHQLDAHLAEVVTRAHLEVRELSGDRVDLRRDRRERRAQETDRR